MKKNLKWYILNVYSGFESKVAALIEEEVKKKGFQDYFGEILVPTEKVVEIKKGKKSEVDKKFFPGYILVQMFLNDDSWHLVRSIPRVSNFLGAKNKPRPMSEHDVENVYHQIKDGENPRNSVSYEIGDQVKVLEGPFATFTGVVEYVNDDEDKLTIAISIFGTLTKLDLNFMQVEKVK